MLVSNDSYNYVPMYLLIITEHAIKFQSCDEFAACEANKIISFENYLWYLFIELMYIGTYLFFPYEFLPLSIELFKLI